MGTVFWMTGFFNPQGFLTAMRQEVTPKMKEEFSSPPAEGVYVHGMFLDGAGWDRKGCKLQESQLKVLFVPLPVVHIFAINSMAVSPASVRKDTYQCPVYKKPCRTDLTFITSLYLKCGGKPAERWIMRGVALLCDVK